MFITLLGLHLYCPQINFLVFGFVDEFDEAGGEFDFEFFELFVVLLFGRSLFWNEGNLLDFWQEHSAFFLGEEIGEEFGIFLDEVDEFFGSLGFLDLVDHLIFEFHDTGLIFAVLLLLGLLGRGLLAQFARIFFLLFGRKYLKFRRFNHFFNSNLSL